ncbi:MAG: Asp23/Gls24 family envelope stress response protein [Chloroflexi bacterium]|nr:Asp23/Gls24 family envelope stress response protein [Chloroflexota bacterium]
MIKPEKQNAETAQSQTTGGKGKIEISPNAIATLVANTVLECYGVVGMAGKTKFDDWRAGLLNLDDIHRGVSVRITKDGVTVNIYVIVEYGTRISEVAHGVMRRVHYTLSRQVGLPVAAVNVHVQGLRVS